MKIYCDGYTIGANPSNVGGGFVVMNEDLQILSHFEIKKSHFTNNEAELLAALKAMELAEPYDEIITDSTNTVAWITKCKVKARPDLLPFAIKARDFLTTKHLDFYQRPREENLAGIHIETVLHL